MLLLGLTGMVLSYDCSHYGEKLSKPDCKSADWFERNEKKETIEEVYSSYNLYSCRYEEQSIEECNHVEPVLTQYRKYYVRCIYNHPTREVKPYYDLVPYCQNANFVMTARPTTTGRQPLTTSKASIKNQTKDEKLNAKLEELSNQLKQNNMSEENCYQKIFQNIDSFRGEELHHIIKVKIILKNLNETLNKILSKVNKNILH